MVHSLAPYLVFPALVLALTIAALFIYRRFPVRKIYRSKQHLESAIDSIDEPISVITRDYRILRANISYAAMVNRPFTHILGHVCHQILRGRTTPCEGCLLHKTLDTQKGSSADLSPHPRGDGVANFSFHPFRRSEGETAVCVVEHIRDISEQQRLRLTLEAKNHSLEQNARELQQAQAQLVEEINLARQVQQGILPREVPVLRGIRVDVSYHPIEAIGGDLYDFIPFSNAQMGLFIGDASGHGLPAALVGTMAKMSLFHHTQHELPANELMSRMNADLLRHLHSGHYLTCFWGVINTIDNTFRFSRAGHPKPIVIRADGEVLNLHSAGTFLGIIEGLKYQEQVFQCRKGDRIYLYTDGVYVVTIQDGLRAPGLNNDSFQKIVEACNSKPFAEIIPAINEQLSHFTYEDDYTLIVIEITDESWTDRVRSAGGFSPEDDVSLSVVRDYAHEAEQCAGLFQAMRENGYDERDIYSLGICLSELIHNAMHHGNQDAPDLSVFVGHTVDETRVRVAVMDQGTGFDLSKIMAVTESEDLQGKGMHLVKRFTTSMTQNSAGNCIIITKNRG